jgi:hypothetical protein
MSRDLTSTQINSSGLVMSAQCWTSLPADVLIGLLVPSVFLKATVQTTVPDFPPNVYDLLGTEELQRQPPLRLPSSDLLELEV